MTDYASENYWNRNATLHARILSCINFLLLFNKLPSNLGLQTNINIYFTVSAGQTFRNRLESGGSVSESQEVAVKR